MPQHNPFPESRQQVWQYHQTTKHHFYAFARGPGYLDWATQPDPFRRYAGAPLLPLKKIPPTDQPPYEAIFQAESLPSAPLTYKSVSQLLFDSLAISAWKQAGQSRWALRVNPSSGNLHPTEGYLICGPVAGLTEQPLVAHYAPQEHLLEQRTQFSAELWQRLTVELPANTLFIGLSSIHWREAWKYGERAFRYCHHDVGHALATITLAAAGLGWQTRLLDELSTDQVGSLLGLNRQQWPADLEIEHPDCLLAIYPATASPPTSYTLPAEAIAAFSQLTWQGEPNQLSPDHVDWSLIDQVAHASRKPATDEAASFQLQTDRPHYPIENSPPLRQIIHQRRSAVAFDKQTGLSRERFYQILSKTLPGQLPFTTLPWRPRIHLALFVHLIADLLPGLYILVRESSQTPILQEQLRSTFVWDKPSACPAHLPLYHLQTGDARAVAGQLSCQQAIAADGCFSLGMLAEFGDEWPAWRYPRLFWESGLLGQMLYLEAEVAGIRGTGIGCFFDDPVHELFGLTKSHYQSLYHFTMGGPVEDSRLTTLPAYPDL